MISILDELRKHNDPELIQTVSEGILHKKVRKGQVLQQKGDKVVSAYFVTKGCLRSYTLDQKGKEHIYMFAPEGWIMSDIGSGPFDKQSELYIDAIEDSEVEVLQVSLLDLSAKVKPDFFGFGMEKLLKRVAVLQKRVIMLMSASALERYEDFIQTYPNIIQRVPQKMIASYLGITPEALSKIRGEMARKQNV